MKKDIYIFELKGIFRLKKILWKRHRFEYFFICKQKSIFLMAMSSVVNLFLSRPYRVSALSTVLQIKKSLLEEPYSFQKLI
jgi:hypothetical protein